MVPDREDPHSASILFVCDLSGTRALSENCFCVHLFYDVRCAASVVGERYTAPTIAGIKPLNNTNIRTREAYQPPIVCLRRTLPKRNLTLWHSHGGVGRLTYILPTLSSCCLPCPVRWRLELLTPRFTRQYTEVSFSRSGATHV